MKILIANDGSKFGFAALDFAINIIDPSRKTQVKVVTVIEPAASIELETIIESAENLIDPENPLARSANEIGERSTSFLREKLTGGNIDISHEVLGGPAARTIVETAEGWAADLIIIGSHGYGFWKRAWLGSISNRVAHHAPCSVLIVR